MPDTSQLSDSELMQWNQQQLASQQPTPNFLLAGSVIALGALAGFFLGGTWYWGLAGGIVGSFVPLPAESSSL